MCLHSTSFHRETNKTQPKKYYADSMTRRVRSNCCCWKTDNYRPRNCTSMTRVFHPSSRWRNASFRDATVSRCRSFEKWQFFINVITPTAQLHIDNISSGITTLLQRFTGPCLAISRVPRISVRDESLNKLLRGSRIDLERSNESGNEVIAWKRLNRLSRRNVSNLTEVVKMIDS